MNLCKLISISEQFAIIALLHHVGLKTVSIQQKPVASFLQKIDDSGLLHKNPKSTKSLFFFLNFSQFIGFRITDFVPAVVAPFLCLQTLKINSHFVGRQYLKTLLGCFLIIYRSHGKRPPLKILMHLTGRET